MTGADAHVVYTWDAENRLTSVSPAAPEAGSVFVLYTYDYRGRRVERQAFDWDDIGAAWEANPAAWTRWVYYDWLPIVEYDVDPSTQALTLTKKFTWGMGIALLLARRLDAEHAPDQ